MELFVMEPVSEHIQRIRTPFGVSMYLVQGNQKALLIDTGMGVGDLRSFVEEHVHTPYTVMATHGHCDHCGGASQFDEVYLNEKDFPLEKWHATREHRIHDVFSGPFGVPDGVREEMFVPQRTDPYTPLDENKVFDLGGCSVHLIACPGHTHGILIPLIDEDRVMIIGDAVGENTLMHFRESTSVETYRHSLKRLMKIESRYGHLLRFHGAGESRHAIIDDMYELTDQILNHEDAAIPVTMMEFKGMMARPEKHPGKEGNLIYNPHKLMKEQEKNA